MIKIWLQYPWKFADSSYYRNLINYPLKGVEYLNKKMFKTINSKWGFSLNRFAKDQVRKIMKFVSVPNLTYTKNKECDLIHCAHCLSLNKKPWIVDFERYETLSVNWKFVRSNRGVRMMEKFLKKENCKKILPWTEAARDSFTDYIKDKDILDKIEVLPFALPLKNYKSKKEKGRINILFVGRYFEAKGGNVAVRVMDFLTKKYPQVYGIVVSETPEEIVKKYKGNEKMKFYGLMEQEKLFSDIYSKADIFFYPGFSDTFGFALVEVLGFKLPVVTFDGFARDEIIEDGRNGYVIRHREKDDVWRGFRKSLNADYISEAIEKTEKLVLDAGLRKRMGDYGFKMVKDGKFSIKNRDKILKNVYDESLR